MPLTGIGYAYYQKKDYQKALDYYQEALQVNSEYLLAVFRSGEAYFALDMNEKAIDSFTHTTAVAADFVEGHYRLGLAYMKARQAKDAIDSFERVIRISPASEQARNARSYLKILK